MSGIDGARGVQTWLEKAVSGPDGPVTRARESVRDTLADGGFVDVNGGTLSTLRARLGIQLSLSEETVMDLGAASRLVTSLRKLATEQVDLTEQTLDDMGSDRIAALLWQ